MKKFLFYLCLVCIILAFKGCIGPLQTNYVETIGYAYVLSPQDSFKIRFYNLKGYPTDTIFSPSNYLEVCPWYPEQSEDIPHSEEKHELHVKKLTNKSESIVIEGYHIYINDTLWGYNSFTDPADSIAYFWNWDKLARDTVIIRIKQCPYKLADVIEQLSLHYPDLIHRLNDTEEHNFSNYQIIRDIKQTPRIYLPKKPK